MQETVARLGIATGKGHAAMIYQRFGKWSERFSLIDLLAVCLFDIGNLFEINPPLVTKHPAWLNPILPPSHLQ